MLSIRTVFIFLIILAPGHSQYALAAQRTENHQVTPLMQAAYNGDLRTMRQLISQGADVNEVNSVGFPALFYAAGATRTGPKPKGSTDAVNLLIKHAAKVNIKSKNGYTALMAACDNENAESAASLVAHGANVSAQTVDGESPLDIAATRLQPEIVALLVEHGANVNSTDKFGSTPLISAVSASPYVDMRSPEDATTIIQQRSLEFARALKITKLLLENKADANMKDQNGKSALSTAVNESNAILVRTLLDHDANPNIVDESQGSATPLILAVKNRHGVIAQMLIKKGANPSIKDHSNKSALDYSREFGPPKMTEILLQTKK
jgi:ankyrin repeat protein